MEGLWPGRLLLYVMLDSLISDENNREAIKDMQACVTEI